MLNSNLYRYDFGGIGGSTNTGGITIKPILPGSDIIEEIK